MTSKELIIRRVAKEFKNNDIVNLGIGMPTMATDFIPEGINIIVQAEHGFIGMGPKPKEGEENWNLVTRGADRPPLSKEAHTLIVRCPLL
jgi:acyl CoA:acetate/3-ketoacid CoA transferase beta subunit